ncbi:biotin synthase-like enzyme [Myroides gitamensis]|nr:biotin synthase-like enzyme [Myroides gitamensis]
MKESKAPIRNNWTAEEIQEIYDLPIMELVYQAATVHRQYHNPLEVQVSTLLSIKTGGCPEDCSYCGQAARYHTDIKVQRLLPLETVLKPMLKKPKPMDPLVFVWLQHGVRFAITETLIKSLTW